jgi:hypothetical protein
MLDYSGRNGQAFSHETIGDPAKPDRRRKGAKWQDVAASFHFRVAQME